MRRAVLTLGGTVAGLAALFSFKTHSAAVAAAAPEPSPLTSSATPSAAPSESASKPLASPKSKPSASKSAKASASPAAARSTAPASTAPTTRAPATPTAPATTRKPTAPATTPAPATSAPAGKSGSFTGATENTQFGQVEVQITVSSGKITNATELIQPEDSIGSNAISQLNGEAVAAQSASIQAVSGATYTSQGYISSLQGAVDSAGL